MLAYVIYTYIKRITTFKYVLLLVEICNNKCSSYVIYKLYSYQIHLT